MIADAEPGRKAARERDAEVRPADQAGRGDVVDAHLHMIAAPMIREWTSGAGEDAERVRREMEEGRRRRRGSVAGEMELLDVEPEEMARIWAQRLAEQGVRQGVFMSFVPRSDYFRRFVSAIPDTIFACCTLDPRDEDAPQVVRHEIEAGFVGVKLYPVNGAYRVSDERARPFFDAVAELGVPVCIHYGVSVDTRADMRFASPIDLSPVARDHPDIPFIVAHFGAGYLEDVLRLSYQCPNVYVDSSGTNNWMRVVPYCQTLRQVFEITLAAMGASRVLFGTDSGAVPAGYRDWILAEQKAVVEGLSITGEERHAILAGNARRLYGLPPGI